MCSNLEKGKLFLLGSIFYYIPIPKNYSALSKLQSEAVCWGGRNMKEHFVKEINGWDSHNPQLFVINDGLVGCHIGCLCLILFLRFFFLSLTLAYLALGFMCYEPRMGCWSLTSMVQSWYCQPILAIASLYVKKHQVFPLEKPMIFTWWLPFRHQRGTPQSSSSY